MKRTVLLLSFYATAMALLEAAVVVYMRQLYYPDNPLELFPLAFLDSYDPLVELSRELATIIMIITVALLAERRSWTRCFAAFVLVFGVWDVFYYVWLRVLMDWPQQWLEWDVLFLIPMIWLGPWICPALIAMLFVAWGGWALLTARDVSFDRWSLTTFTAGAVVGLYSFMQPAMGLTTNQLRHYTPDSVPSTQFNWPIYAVGFGLMAAGFLMTARPRLREAVN